MGFPFGMMKTFWTSMGLCQASKASGTLPLPPRPPRPPPSRIYRSGTRSRACLQPHIDGQSCSDDECKCPGAAKTKSHTPSGLRHRDRLSHHLEARSPRPRSRHGWFLLGPLSRLLRAHWRLRCSSAGGPIAHLCLHLPRLLPACASVSVFKFPFCEDTRHPGSGPTPMTSS